MGEDEWTVRIGPREVYDAVVKLQGAVERLIDSDTVIRDDFRKHEELGKEMYIDHEDRIRSLERSRWPLPSISILLAIGSLVFALFQFLGG